MESVPSVVSQARPAEARTMPSGTIGFGPKRGVSTLVAISWAIAMTVKIDQRWR